MPSYGCIPATVESMHLINDNCKSSKLIIITCLEGEMFGNQDRFITL